MQKKQPTSKGLTYTRELDVLKPQTFKPNMAEVFRALPKINRFNGQTSVPYSVARHSILCTMALEYEYEECRPHLLLAMLLHDAGEAYIGDITRPIKNELNKNLVAIEYEILNNVYCLQNFTPAQMKDIYSNDFQDKLNEVDNRMACTEADMLRAPAAIRSVQPYVQRFEKLTLQDSDDWRLDEKMFKTMYEDLLWRTHNED